MTWGKADYTLLSGKGRLHDGVSGMITVLFIKLCVCVEMLTVIEYRKCELSFIHIVEFS